MAARYHHLYSQEALPVFQNKVYESPQEAKACPLGDVSLVQDLQTGLIFNEAFRPELVVYDADYQNEQGLSRHFQQHLHQVLRIIDRTTGRTNLVEVGCGKGFFLEMLLAAGFDVTGFDPTYEGNNPKVKRCFFEKGVGIEANGLILRHVLEHIQDPLSFLQNLAQANRGRGLIYIEVPCFDWICERRTWFDVFYEHVNYFRLSDFHRIFGHVIESGRIFGGQYLYVVAELSSIQVPEYEENDRYRFPKDFACAIPKTSEEAGQKCAVWGAASKGVVF
jgi:SAM-dependent methyltransferase